MRGTMKVTVLKERDTPLLARKRVTLEAEYGSATPSRLDLKKEVAKKLSADDKLVILKHIYTRFGKQKAKIIAHIYSDEKEMKRLENDVLVKKHFKEEKKEEAAPAAEAAPAEEKPAEAPKEEAKEEKPAEAEATEEKKEEAAPAEEKKE